MAVFQQVAAFAEYFQYKTKIGVWGEKKVFIWYNTVQSLQ